MSLYPQVELVNPNVAVIWLGDGENKFAEPFLTRLESLLDQVEKDEQYSDVRILVTSAKGRFYSNGLDLEWVVKQDQATATAYIRQINRCLVRILTYPIPTVAALNGHAFAGGALLAMAHDARIMQTKRGWLSLPEIFLELPFRAGMLDLLRCKVPTQAIRNFVMLGHRLTAEQAHNCGLIDTVATTNNWKDLLQDAIELGEALLAGRDMARSSMAMLKGDLYAHTVRQLTEDNGEVDPRVLGRSKL